MSSASFLQTPAWATVKPDWRAESLGWFDGQTLRGVALVLYRPIPRLKWSLAYVPEGPVIDYSGAPTPGELKRWLDPLAAHTKAAGAFALRIGPPELTHAWSAATLKAGLADESVLRLSALTPDITHPAGVAVTDYLRGAGWLPVGEGEGFAAGQPAYNFTLPLVTAEGEPLDEDALLAGMNQLWRRNIRKAAKLGVSVDVGTREDMAEFHRIYVETAARDGFTPRPLSYFLQMWDALNGEDPDRMRLFMTRHEGDLVASAIYVQVGTHAWYAYGASTTHKRDVRGSNAMQWRMMTEALSRGAHEYDMRGITDTLDASDRHVGLINFKLGTGGIAVHRCGEWDLPIRRTLYKGFMWYLARRESR